MSQKNDLLYTLWDVQKHTKKHVLDATKLYVFHIKRSACVLFSLWYVFFLVGDRVSVNRFKYGIAPSLKANDGLKIYQDAEMNHELEKGKIWCKLSYKCF